jgi:hypothetical protein
VNKLQLLDKLTDFATGDIAQSHLTDKQYNEIVSLSVRVSELPNSDISKIAQIRMIIALYQKLDVKNVTAPRDVQAKQEQNAFSAYNTAMARNLAIWKMSLNTPPTEEEEVAKTALLDKAYRANLANKAENARKRNDYIQSV